MKKEPDTESISRFKKELEKLGYKATTQKMYAWHANTFEIAMRKKFRQEDRPVTRFLKNVQAKPIATKKFAIEYLRDVQKNKSRDYFRQACSAVFIYMRRNIHPTLLNKETLHGIQQAG